MSLSNCFSGRRFAPSFVACCLVVSGLAIGAENRAEWMQTARWGVMNHYLADWIARGGIWWRICMEHCTSEESS